MNPKRRNRLLAVLFVLAGTAGAVALLLLAANENLNLFHPPEQIVSGAAPVGVPIRAGGMVLEGSVARSPNSLDVQFVLTDYQGSGVQGGLQRHPAGPVPRRAGHSGARGTRLGRACSGQ